MRNGFSLVELSIVLVILGLLTGGILAGQSLIRASELRSVSTEYDHISAALYTFKDNYFALPGDMRNATDYWGIAAGSTGDDATCRAASGAGTTTCNGDGNGTIAGGGNEMYRVWEHLANADLIEGSYTGIAGSGGSNDHDPGVNAMRSKVNQSGWGMRNFDSTDFAGVVFLYDYGNVLLLGGDTTTLPIGDIMTNEEAWNIDTKIDDGLPGQGNLLAFDHVNCSLAANTSDYNAAYDLADSGTHCALIFRADF